MSLTRTTIAAAITDVAANVVTVTSGTGFAAGDYCRINDEFCRVQAVSSDRITIKRGQLGTPARTHGILSVIVTGPPADWREAADAIPRIYTYGAAGAITPQPGLHRLAAASAAAMTLVAPTADQEGDVLLFIATAAQAYTITVPSTTHLNALTNHVMTFAGAIGDCIELIAINESWCVTLNKNVTLSAS